MWKVISSSAIGTSHQALTLPCQDYCLTEVVKIDDGSEYLIVLVSDGAGSAQLGGKGAELACSRALESISCSLKASFHQQNQEEGLTEEWVKQWVETIRETINKEAIEVSLKPRDFACTLLGAVIGPRQGIFFQIGDGAIIVSSGSVQGVVFWPDSGTYANETSFLTDENALQSLRIILVPTPINELALFSDGLQRLALRFIEEVPHYQFFDPMFAALRQTPIESCSILKDRLADFLSSLPINERTDDDKTLILATRRNYDRPI